MKETPKGENGEDELLILTCDLVRRPWLQILQVESSGWVVYGMVVLLFDLVFAFAYSETEFEVFVRLGIFVLVSCGWPFALVAFLILRERNLPEQLQLHQKRCTLQSKRTLHFDLAQLSAFRIRRQLCRKDHELLGTYYRIDLKVEGKRLRICHFTAQEQAFETLLTILAKRRAMLLAAQIREGATVRFGRVSASPEGLTTKRTQLAWQAMMRITHRIKHTAVFYDYRETDPVITLPLSADHAWVWQQLALYLAQQETPRLEEGLYLGEWRKGIRPLHLGVSLVLIPLFGWISYSLVLENHPVVGTLFGYCFLRLSYHILHCHFCRFRFYTHALRRNLFWQSQQIDTHRVIWIDQNLQDDGYKIIRLVLEDGSQFTITLYQPEPDRMFDALLQDYAIFPLDMKLEELRQLTRAAVS